MSRAELTGIVRDCNVAGIGEVFVIGGDRKQSAGPYDVRPPVAGRHRAVLRRCDAGRHCGLPGGPPLSGCPGPGGRLGGQATPGHARRHADVLLRAENPGLRGVPPPGRRAAARLGRGSGVRPADQAGLPGHADRRRKFPEVPQPQGAAGTQAPERGSVRAVGPDFRACRTPRPGGGHPLLQLQRPCRGDRWDNPSHHAPRPANLCRFQEQRNEVSD